MFFKSIIGIVFACLSAVSFNANTAVLATWDLSSTAAGSMNCFPNACPTMPDNVTISIGYENHPDVPISYTYLFVLEELLDTSNIGDSFIVNETNSSSNFYVNNFNYFSSRATNGVDEILWPIMWLGDVRQDDGTLNNTFGGWGAYWGYESDGFVKTYSSPFPDLTGTTITSVEFLLTSLNIDKTYPDPYSVNYNYDLTGIFTINGDINPVPIPSAMLLFGSGLLGLIGLARRKRAYLYKR